MRQLYVNGRFMGFHRLGSWAQNFPVAKSQLKSRPKNNLCPITSAKTPTGQVAERPCIARVGKKGKQKSKCAECPCRPKSHLSHKMIQNVNAWLRGHGRIQGAPHCSDVSGNLSLSGHERQTCDSIGEGQTILIFLCLKMKFPL